MSTDFSAPLAALRASSRTAFNSDSRAWATSALASRAASAASSASATTARTVAASASSLPESSSIASEACAAAAVSSAFFSKAARAALRALISAEARWATAAAAVSAAFFAPSSASAIRRFIASLPARMLSRCRSISSASLARRRACSAWRSALPPPSCRTGITTMREAARMAQTKRNVSRPSRLSGMMTRIASTAMRSAATRNHFSLRSFSSSRLMGWGSGWKGVARPSADARRSRPCGGPWRACGKRRPAPGRRRTSGCGRVRRGP